MDGANEFCGTQASDGRMMRRDVLNQIVCFTPERAREGEGEEGRVVELKGSLLPAMVVAANRWSADAQPEQEIWITVLYLQRNF